MGRAEILEAGSLLGELFANSVDINNSRGRNCVIIGQIGLALLSGEDLELVGLEDFLWGRSTDTMNELDWCSISVFRKERNGVFTSFDLLELFLHGFVHIESFLNIISLDALIFVLQEHLFDHLSIRKCLLRLFDFGLLFFL